MAELKGITRLATDELVVKSNVRLNGAGVADEGLIDSVKRLGVIQPLTVRSVDGEWVVTDGHRRLDAARKAKIADVPVHVQVGREVPKDDATLIAQQVATALHRKRLTDFELVQASWDMKLAGMTQPEIADALSITKSNVSDLHKVARVLSKDENLDQQQANLFSYEALRNVAEADLDERVSPSDVIAVVARGDARDVRDGIQRVNEEAKVMAFYDEVNADLSKWSSDGIQITKQDPVSDRDNYGSLRAKKNTGWIVPPKAGHGSGAQALELPVSKHMALECHMVYVREPSYWSDGSIAHACIDVKSHTVNGSSDLKLKNAAEVAKAEAEKKPVMSAAKAKQLRVDQAKVWLDGKHNQTSDLELAVEFALEGMASDTYREFSRLLGYYGERETGNYDWHKEAYLKYLDENFGDNEKARNLFTIRLMKAATYTVRPPYITPAPDSFFGQLQAIEPPSDE